LRRRIAAALGKLKSIEDFRRLAAAAACFGVGTTVPASAISKT